jgi:hypothetical protein
MAPVPVTTATLAVVPLTCYGLEFSDFLHLFNFLVSFITPRPD